jgi:LacI family transcriptional regulator
MDTIAFVCFDESFWGSYWTSILSGLENTLRNTNANLQFIVITQEEHQSNALPASLTKWEIDGIITCGVFSSDYYVKLKSLGIPMVTLDVSPELTSINAICDVVMVENEPAVYTLTKNLIEKGHRDICFVGSIESSLSFQERWNGFCRAMREYGLPCEPASNLTEYSETKYYNCSEIIQKLSDRKRTPSAFVCGNDSVACVFNALTKPPYNYLPSNIQLTGFDHIAEYSSLLDSCPTVEIYPEEIGKQLAELLQWRRQNPGRQFRTVRLNVKPILR